MCFLASLRFPVHHDSQQSVCRTPRQGTRQRALPNRRLGSQYHPSPPWRPPSPPALSCPSVHNQFGHGVHQLRHGPNPSHDPSHSQEPRAPAPTATTVSDQPRRSRPGTLPNPICPRRRRRRTTAPTRAVTGLPPPQGPLPLPPPTHRRSAGPSTDTAPSSPPRRATMPS